jgi:hypothetical protein
MRLTQLEHAVDFTLSAPFILHRVQRLRSRRGTVAVGALRLPPRGLLSGRFDLPDDEVGYFAESGETAVYETLARREAATLAMSAVAARALLTLRTTSSLQLIDLRFHANAWPVLQSLRYDLTQGLSRDARDLGYQGIVYRSSQQYGADCFAIFGRGPLASLRLESRVPLRQPGTGALHRTVADAVRGSMVPVVE